MFVLNSNNIYQTFAPLHWVLKIFGLAAYQLELNNSRVLKISTNKMYIIIYCTFYISLLTIDLYWGEQEPDAEESLLIRHGWHKLYLIEMICLTIITIVNYKHQDTTIKCLELINEIDKMEEFSWNQSLNHSHQRMICVLFIVGIVFYCFIILTISFIILDLDERDYIHLLSMASNILCSQMIAIIGYQFIFFSGCLKSRFEVLLRNIEENCSFLRRKEILSDMELLKALQFINNIYVCHTSLNKILKNINSLYSFQVSLLKFHKIYIINLRHFPLKILVTIFAAIVSNVVTAFSLIRLFLTSDLDYDKLSIAIISNVWNVAVTLPVIISFYLSSDINGKNIKVMEIVSINMLNCRNPIIMRKVKHSFVFSE